MPRQFVRDFKTSYVEGFNAKEILIMMMLQGLFFGGAAISTALGNLGILILRLFVGITLAAAHGLGKIPPTDRFIEGVGAMGFPMPMVFAWAAGLSEFLGGLLIAIGLFTRPAAFFVMATMGVAFFIRHAADPFQRKELALAYMAIALAIFLIGCGRFGLDALYRVRHQQ